VPDHVTSGDPKRSRSCRIYTWIDTNIPKTVGDKGSAPKATNRKLHIANQVVTLLKFSMAPWWMFALFECCFLVSLYFLQAAAASTSKAYSCQYWGRVVSGPMHDVSLKSSELWSSRYVVVSLHLILILSNGSSRCMASD